VHMCVLTVLGQVFSCGKKEYTGLNTTQDVLVPTHLDAFDGQEISQVSVGSGGYHTMAVTARGDVYAWGHHRVRQLGLVDMHLLMRNDDGAWYLPRPLKITPFPSNHDPSVSTADDGVHVVSEGVVRAVAGWGHSALITAAGHLYMVGRYVHTHMPYVTWSLLPFMAILLLYCSHTILYYITVLLSVPHGFCTLCVHLMSTYMYISTVTRMPMM
jgi:alpha-tubulin suppressor-like RCC1 family protein